MGNRSSKKQPPVIAQCSAPGYCVKSIGSRHILLAGGGGAAKTGVANRIETLLLSFDGFPQPSSSASLSSAAGQTTVALKAHLTSALTTDPHATMNMDVIGIGAPEQGRYLLATGHDQYCDIYESKGFSLCDEGDKSDAKSSSRVTINFERITRIVSDEKPSGAYQKTVRFDRSAAGHPCRFITGGADGCVRVWDVESLRKSPSDAKMKPLMTLLAHKGDVDDLDISWDGRNFVSIGYDAHVYLWDMTDGKRLLELPPLPEIGNEFRVRSIRFTALGSSNVIFVVAYNQIRRTTKSVCYLALWAFNRERNACKPILVKEACRETISTLAVSECGNFTAIGTLGGSVAVFDTHEMKAIYFARETHGIFVTGIEFLPSRTIDFPPLKDPAASGGGPGGDGGGASPERNGRRQPRPFYPGVASEYRTAVVSLSADQTVQFHAVPFSAPTSLTFFLVKLSIFVAFLYYLVWYLCGNTGATASRHV